MSAHKSFDRAVSSTRYSSRSHAIRTWSCGTALFVLVAAGWFDRLSPLASAQSSRAAIVATDPKPIDLLLRPPRMGVFAAGGEHTCGISGPIAGGSAYCWGLNNHGQVGDGTFGGTHEVPIPVAGGRAYTYITAGQNHTCALDTLGIAYCWGENTKGQLGLGPTHLVDANRPERVDAPTAFFESVAAGGNATCAIEKGTHNAYCWGDNANDQLGLGSNAPRQTNRLRLVAGGNTFSRLTLSDAPTGDGGFGCGILLNDTANCWGSNGLGQLGDGTFMPKNRPTLLSPSLNQVTFSSIDAGFSHTCAILKSNGKGYCWGSNNAGSLGNDDPSQLQQSRPVAVVMPTADPFVQVVAGQDYTCALGRGIFCWGLNAKGQFGNGKLAGSLIPIRGPSSILVSGPWSLLAGGRQHVCAVTFYGDAYCWGSNASGALGNDTHDSEIATTPQRVSGGHRFL